MFLNKFICFIGEEAKTGGGGVPAVTGVRTRPNGVRTRPDARVQDGLSPGSRGDWGADASQRDADAS